MTKPQVNLLTRRKESFAAGRLKCLNARSGTASWTMFPVRADNVGNLHALKEAMSKRNASPNRVNGLHTRRAFYLLNICNLGITKT